MNDRNGIFRNYNMRKENTMKCDVGTVVEQIFRGKVGSLIQHVFVITFRTIAKTYLPTS